MCKASAVVTFCLAFVTCKMPFMFFFSFIFKVRAVMGIDFKMIKIHEIVVDSGPICKKSSGKLSVTDFKPVPRALSN